MRPAEGICGWLVVDCNGRMAVVGGAQVNDVLGLWRWEGMYSFTRQRAKVVWRGVERRGEARRGVERCEVVCVWVVMQKGSGPVWFGGVDLMVGQGLYTPSDLGRTSGMRASTAHNMVWSRT